MANLTIKQRITISHKAKEAKDKIFEENMLWYLENLTPLETIEEIMGAWDDDNMKLRFFKEIAFNSSIKFKNK